MSLCVAGNQDFFHSAKLREPHVVSTDQHPVSSPFELAWILGLAGRNQIALLKSGGTSGSYETGNEKVPAADWQAGNILPLEPTSHNPQRGELLSGTGDDVPLVETFSL